MATKKQVRENRERLEQYLRDLGFEQDKWGHYRYGNIRVKMQARSFRYEKRIKLSTGYEWLKFAGTYYSKLTWDSIGTPRDGAIAAIPKYVMISG